MRINKYVLLLLLFVIVHVSKILSTAWTGRTVLHLDEPLHYTFFMKGMLTCSIRRPYNRFALLVGAKANGTAVGDTSLLARWES